jgi:hypothetical protein
MNPRRFKDPHLDINSSIPGNWGIRRFVRLQTNEAILTFWARGIPSFSCGMYYHILDEPVEMSYDARVDWLKRAAELKRNQRQTQLKYRDYAVADESFEVQQIAGNAALTWSATFIWENEEWSEHLVRIVGQRARVLQFLRCPSTSNCMVKKAFEEFSASTRCS